MTIDCKNEQYEMGGKQFPCSTSITMEFIGGKYKTVILFHLRNAALRYNELRKFMPVVTERTLSLQLKQLEQDGLLKRTVYTTKPPLKVEYELTDFGKTLLPMLMVIAEWGRDVAAQKASVVKV
ncbi:winged helix-turn-helix transcriptional regulator [Flavobacterium selenitireducens]|uniref:winged helix-turn-helix transcriptional regulator n=1 Tax=Flavobacterium selenitireducens TaxID=2722704 RepID=UPI00168AAF10|nr:helix-turn-helix domain-containing protein [Flavobacterium selenitireducens]MBD3582878.1 helix-turn-helix transcriptional regulator [Flavobacterium selenitireducens]